MIVAFDVGRATAKVPNPTPHSLRPRLYAALLQDHFLRNRQMAFVSGPRQVGKSTACRAVGDVYLNWDNPDDRRILLKGPAALADFLGLDRLRIAPPITVLDELHKHAQWKALLKGFFDTYGERTRLLFTGSSRLDVFRRGGDSLMARYFLYRMHPWSVAECARVSLPAQEIQHHRLTSMLPTGTRYAFTEAFPSRSFAGTSALRAAGILCAWPSWRRKTCAKSPGFKSWAQRKH